MNIICVDNMIVLMEFLFSERKNILFERSLWSRWDEICRNLVKKELPTLTDLLLWMLVEVIASGILYVHIMQTFSKS